MNGAFARAISFSLTRLLVFLGCMREHRCPKLYTWNQRCSAAMGSRKDEYLLEYTATVGRSIRWYGERRFHRLRTNGAFCEQLKVHEPNSRFSGYSWTSQTH